MAYKRECPIPQAEAVGALGESCRCRRRPLVASSRVNIFSADAMYLSYLGIWPYWNCTHHRGLLRRCGRHTLPTLPVPRPAAFAHPFHSGWLIPAAPTRPAGFRPGVRGGVDMASAEDGACERARVLPAEPGGVPPAWCRRSSSWCLRTRAAVFVGRGGVAAITAAAAASPWGGRLGGGRLGGTGGAELTAGAVTASGLGAGVSSGVGDWKLKTLQR